MCAINPKRQDSFIIEVYTSHDMKKEDFDKAVMEKLLEVKQKLNEDGRFRFHLKGTSHWIM